MKLLRALRSRNYLLLFSGQAISLIGMWMQATAQQSLMDRLTESAGAVALLTAVQTGPGLVLGPFAGALADRWDRRKMLVATQIASLVPAFLLAVLTLLDRIDPKQIIALGLAAGIIRAFELPVRQAFVPETVEREDLPNAISLNSALFNSARMVGPALAGLVMRFSSEGWCFMANAISFLAPIATLALIHMPAQRPRLRNGSSMISDVLEGIRYVRQQRFVLGLLASLALASVLGMPYAALLPSFAREELGDPKLLALLLSTVGLGAIGSALILAGGVSPKGLERVPALGNALFGASLLLLSRSHSLTLALPLMALIGMGAMAQMTATNTLLQRAVPDRLRGRVMSLHSALFLGVVPIGQVIGGAAADKVGQSPVFAVSGALLLVSAIVLGRELMHSSPTAEDERVPASVPKPVDVAAAAAAAASAAIALEVDAPPQA